MNVKRPAENQEDDYDQVMANSSKKIHTEKGGHVVENPFKELLSQEDDDSQTNTQNTRFNMTQDSAGKKKRGNNNNQNNKGPFKIGSARTYKGTYLNKMTGKGKEYVKIQVWRMTMKIESGVEDDLAQIDVQEKIFPSKKLSIDFIEEFVQKKLQEGFVEDKRNFVYDLRATNLRNKAKTENKTNQKQKQRHAIALTRTSIIKVKQEERPLERLNSSTFKSSLSIKNLRKALEKKHPVPSNNKRGSQEQNNKITKQEFEEQIEELDEDEMPLGRPVFEGYQTLTMPSIWETTDPQGWYWCKKNSGIRCFWNGLELWSRRGKKYNPPEYFIKELPKSPLDGELVGKKSLGDCIRVIKKADPKDEDWNDLVFVVSDAPTLELPFRERLERMQKIFGTGHPYFRLNDYRICQGREALFKELKEIEKTKGDGIIIRDALSRYQKGKNRAVLEVRSSFEDKGVVLALKKGKGGKLEGKVVGIKVQNFEGKTFIIKTGITDQVRNNPPGIGDYITYSYCGVIGDGTPKVPAFVKIADKDEETEGR